MKLISISFLDNKSYKLSLWFKKCEQISVENYKYKYHIFIYLIFDIIKFFCEIRTNIKQYIEQIKENQFKNSVEA